MKFHRMKQRFVEQIPEDLNLCLLGLQGSRMLGLAVSEDADYDYRGVFVRPIRDLIGIRQFQETVERNMGAGDNEAEFVFHELGKFVRLSIKGNPSVLHLLFVPKYNFKNNVGDRLVQHRQLLLGAKAIRNAFGGYALSQAIRLQKCGRFGKGLKRRSKHIRHCFRLFDNGRELLETGEIRLPLKNPERYFELEKIEDDDRILKIFEEEDKRFKTTKSDLPEEPNLHLVNELLVELRQQAEDGC